MDPKIFQAELDRAQANGAELMRARILAVLEEERQADEQRQKQLVQRIERLTVV